MSKYFLFLKSCVIINQKRKFMSRTILTGIKPTGVPHIGNYFGAIKPSIESSFESENECVFFIADYHALTTIKDRETIIKNTFELACIWLACGLDPSKVIFYRQSDIPEIFELAWILSCQTPKGLMNRAHAYKNKVESNRENGEEDDINVNMGLYNYPILMASDILIFNSNFVPVGKDQLQHIEIARDIAKTFNKNFGATFVMPKPQIDNDLSVVLGLDGQKMSKSYGNVIPIFAEEKELKKLIAKIVTDSSLPNEPKSTDCAIFKLYKLFASSEEILNFESRFLNGISWAEAKECLYNKICDYFKDMKVKYDFYKSNPNIVEEILENGAKRARKIAQDTINRVRKAVGIDK